MTYTLTFEIDRLPKLPNQLLGTHWTTKAKHAKLWKTLVLQAIISQGVMPYFPRLKKAQIKYTRISAKAPDHDNLVASFKAVQDAMVSHGILEDDNKGVIVRADYEWVRCPRLEGKIRVEVKELTEGSELNEAAL